MHIERYVVLLGLVAAATGCTGKHGNEDEESKTSAQAVVRVGIAPVRRADVDVIVVATGKTDALRRVKVLSPIAGRIQTLNVVEGSAVRTGDVLAVIQSREAQAAIAGAEALLQSAHTPEERSDAERTLSLARSTQNALAVRARVSGFVGTRSVNAGEFVAENGELMTLVDLSTLDFVADVPLGDLPSVHPGEVCAIHFSALPGRSFAGRVDAVYPQSSEQSQTVKVRLRFTGTRTEWSQFLKTEMAGVAGIVVGRHRGALIVPRTAVLRNDETGTNSVVVMTADSLTRLVRVELGVLSESTAEVKSTELREGMPVVVEVNYALADSTRVTVAAAGIR